MLYFRYDYISLLRKLHKKHVFSIVMKNYNSVITCRQGQIYWIGIGWQLPIAKIGMIHQDMYVGDSTGSEAAILLFN